jgi:Arabinose efflux permease
MQQLLEHLRRYGRFQRNARLYLVSMALSYVTVGMITVLYNLYLVALGYDTDFIGLILFIGTLGAAIAIFPAGFCVDRYGGKRILLWSSLLIGIAGAGQMLFRTPLPLLVSAFVAGIGGAFILVVNAPFLTLNSTEEERPHLFSLNIVLALVTTVIGETLGGLLPLWFGAVHGSLLPVLAGLHGILVSQPQALSYQLSLLTAGIIATPSFIPLFMMHDDRLLYRQQSELAHAVPLRTPSVYWHASVKRLQTFFSPEYLKQYLTYMKSPLAVLTALYALQGLGAGLFIPYMNVYFVQRLGATPALFGSIDGAANILNALLTLVAPWFVLRCGILVTLLVPRLLAIPLMLVIGCVPFLPLAAALYPVRQGLADMSQGILQVFSMERVSSRHRGLANSSYQVAFQGSWALGAPLGGLLIKNVGYPVVFIMAAVLYCLAYLPLWLRFRRDGGGDGDGDGQASGAVQELSEAVPERP